MQTEIINFEYQKLLKSYDKIGKAIIDYINEMDLVWEIEIAKKVYFGNIEYPSDELKSWTEYKPFIQWLIFSYKLHAGRPLIECIYDQNMSNLYSYEKDTLYMLRNTYEGLYKVYMVEHDKILLKDSFSMEPIYIWDTALAGSIKKYNGLFMRVVVINGKKFPIPGYCAMSNPLLKETEHFIRKKYDEYRKVNKEISIHNFINLNSLMLHRYFLRYSI